MQRNTYNSYKLILSSLFAALICIGAFIKVPLPYYDYFTMQTFFVIMAGLILGPKYGSISSLIYVILGLAGLPIFAAGGGISYILRPSFGYLIGFIIGGFTSGFFAHKFIKDGKLNYLTMLISSIISLLPIYAIGLIYKYFLLKYYLGQPLPWSILLASMFPIDLPIDILCCFIGAMLAIKLYTIKDLKLLP